MCFVFVLCLFRASRSVGSSFVPRLFRVAVLFVVMWWCLVLRVLPSRCPVLKVFEKAERSFFVLVQIPALGDVCLCDWLTVRLC